MSDKPIIPAALASRLACALDGHPLRVVRVEHRGERRYAQTIGGAGDSSCVEVREEYVEYELTHRNKPQYLANLAEVRHVVEWIIRDAEFLSVPNSPEREEIAALLREFPTLWPEVET